MTANLISDFPISKLRTDGGTQTRAGLNQEKIDEYAAAYAAGTTLPPLEAFHDAKGASYWIADGFHRYHGARVAKLKKLPVLVYEGTQADAQWHAAGANKHHGLNRTNEDKRKAVKKALELRPEVSDRQIAEHCGVTHQLVSKMRDELGINAPARVGKDGRVYDAAKIAESQKSRSESTGNGYQSNGDHAHAHVDEPVSGEPRVEHSQEAPADDVPTIQAGAADEAGARCGVCGDTGERRDGMYCDCPAGGALEMGDRSTARDAVGAPDPELDDFDDFEKAVMSGDVGAQHATRTDGAPLDDLAGTLDDPDGIADEPVGTITPAGRAALAGASRQPTQVQDAPSERCFLCNTDHAAEVPCPGEEPASAQTPAPAPPSAPAPAPAAPAPRGPLDAEGKVIPEHLVQVAAALRAVANHLGAIRSLIRSWSMVRKSSHLDDLITDARRHLPEDALKRIDNWLSQKAPGTAHALAADVEDLRLHAVCQDCAGTGCARCPESRGWFTRSEWRQRKHHNDQLELAGLGELRG